MKVITVFSICFFWQASCFAQSAAYWTRITDPSRLTGNPQIKPSQFLIFHADPDLIKNTLTSAPHETQRTSGNSAVITLPLANGKLEEFDVCGSDVMSKDLQNAYPGIRTFLLQGRQNKEIYGTMDYNEFGLHVMIYTPQGVVFIDPYSNSTTEQYLVYYTHHYKKEIPGFSSPDYLLSEFRNENEQEKNSAAPICVGSQLRTYRLIISCTGEYAKAATGLTNPTVQQTLAKIVTSVTRVTGIFESELSVRLQLAATTTMVIFTDPDTDPYTKNALATTILDESQNAITTVIGAANYDIGHTFTAGTSGLAILGCVCKNTDKAKGTTGLPNPFGDPFDVDFVAHEIGHQFNAKHTFNGATGNCAGSQRDAGSAVEPGSGVTVMGYAGICTTNDLALNSIAYFHNKSFDQIVQFVTSASGGCAVVSNTGNQPPVVSVKASHVIPAGTPFILSGTAADPDGHQLSYSWEEADVATVAANWNANEKPFFRSYPPVSSSARSFPTESVVLTGNYTGTRGEYLTSTPQVLQFRLTARDNFSGGAGVCYNTTSVSMVAGGAFKVTYPSWYNIGWAINMQKTITWDVSGTAGAPVNCDSVRILLSYDEGKTYTVFVGSTPNDGSHEIQVPVITGEITTCRIKIECRDNIFYDVSDNNFTISTDPNVGIRELNTLPPRFTLSPNPFRNSFTLSSSESIAGNVEVTVYSMLGQKIADKKLAGSSDMKVDLPEGGTGVYIIRVNDSSGSTLLKAIRD